MRVTTAFNRLLALQGARVTDVLFAANGVTVRVALRRRRAACSACGQVCARVHDRAWRRWRHLDLSGQRCHIEYQLRRVRCPDCGVRVEAVPFGVPVATARKWASSVRRGWRLTRTAPGSGAASKSTSSFCSGAPAGRPLQPSPSLGETLGSIRKRNCGQTA